MDRQDEHFELLENLGTIFWKNPERVYDRGDSLGFELTQTTGAVVDGGDHYIVIMERYQFGKDYKSQIIPKSLVGSYYQLLSFTEHQPPIAEVIPLKKRRANKEK